MFIPTHGNIASAIVKTIPTGNGFSVPAFQVGCTWADVYPGALIPHHTWAESRGYLNILLQMLMKNPDAGETTARDSFLLGVACHLVSDFFCQAHNSPSYQGNFSHLIYEYQLGQEFKQANLDRLCCSPQIFREASYLSTPASLADYLERIHRDYLQETPGFKTDLLYSMKTTSIFVYSITSYSSRKIVHSAA